MLACKPINHDGLALLGRRLDVLTGAQHLIRGVPDVCFRDGHCIDVVLFDFDAFLEHLWVELQTSRHAIIFQGLKRKDDLALARLAKLSQLAARLIKGYVKFARVVPDELVHVRQVYLLNVAPVLEQSQVQLLVDFLREGLDLETCLPDQSYLAPLDIRWCSRIRFNLWHNLR